MQKAKEEGQVQRQEDMEKVHGNMQKKCTPGTVPLIFCGIGDLLRF